MKKFKLALQLLASFSLVFVLFSFSGCDDDIPDPVNDPELITSVVLTFTPISPDPPVVLSFRDLDGDGGDPPVIVSQALDTNTTYLMHITLLNESVSPAIDLSSEISAEAEDHQFFFDIEMGLDLTFQYSDQDGNGNPVGRTCQFVTGFTDAGSMTVTLRHLPDKSAPGVAAGDITNAGGDTDLEVTFPVTIL